MGEQPYQKHIKPGAQMNRQKRVAAIHDISGFGRCSLTVALPIISACGVETAVMPTALLSTHTGGIEGYSFLDLTGEMRKFIDHWASLNLEFDGIYSGYMGSEGQIHLVSEFISRFKKPGTLAVVDPAMADNGKMYPGFDQKFAGSMAGLCAMADVTVPNITEAAFMLGMEYREGPYDQSYITSLLNGLRGMGAKNVILTGVHFDDRRLGAACMDEQGGVSGCYADRVEGYFHGTGDVFASVVTAAMVLGHSLQEAATAAVDFTQKAIATTKKLGCDVRFGVNFEQGLADLGAAIRLSAKPE